VPPPKFPKLPWFAYDALRIIAPPLEHLLSLLRKLRNDMICANALRPFSESYEIRQSRDEDRPNYRVF
jgi:hypothetical protein